jgi:uncharacterized protein YjbI with pentapeptide repeats
MEGLFKNAFKEEERQLLISGLTNVCAMSFLCHKTSINGVRKPVFTTRSFCASILEDIIAKKHDRTVRTMPVDDSMEARIPQPNVVSDAKLDRAELERLSKTGEPYRLVNCDLEKAKAGHLSFEGWLFDDCNIHAANFTGAKLKSTMWRRCRGGEVFFRAADLSESRSEVCDLNNSVFEGAVLENALYDRSKLVGVKIVDAKTKNLQFEKSILNDAVLSGISFKRQTVTGVHFEYAHLKGCDFSEAVFDESSLRNATLERCKFRGADLRGASIMGFTLATIRAMKGAIISQDQASYLLYEVGVEVL